MRRIIIIFIFCFTAFTAFAQNEITDVSSDVSDDSASHNVTNHPIWDKYLKPNHILDITIEPGAAVYIGKFYDTLVGAGAYIAAPAFDIYISLYIMRYFGIQALLSSGCVIHPKSTPVEGTIFYMGIEMFGIYEWKYVMIKTFAGVGYEHPTWLIQRYASGFFEGGVGVGIKVTDYLAITTSCKYRMGFLHIVDLMKSGERLMSITISAGVTLRIRNL